MLVTRLWSFLFLPHNLCWWSLYRSVTIYGPKTNIHTQLDMFIHNPFFSLLHCVCTQALLLTCHIVCVPNMSDHPHEIPLACHMPKFYQHPCYSVHLNLRYVEHILQDYRHSSHDSSSYVSLDKGFKNSISYHIFWFFLEIK